MLTSLSSSILPLIIISLPSFFIIKRLLSKTPKKVFYFELPLLVVIYLVITFINNLIGLMIGGPRDATISQILTLIIPQIIFVIVWISLLTISLYFYYKKSKIIGS
jgi:purine-cytosine permease-like protein